MKLIANSRSLVRFDFAYQPAVTHFFVVVLFL